jgi:hypothetical protein
VAKPAEKVVEVIEEEAPELPPRDEDSDNEDDDLSRNISQVMSLPGRGGSGRNGGQAGFHQTSSSIDTD